MMNHRRSLSALLITGAVAFLAAACGDDSVNPSTPPDAGAVKDAAGEGGEGGHEQGDGGDAAAGETGGEDAAAPD
jgi:hypothetical protein